MRLAACWLLLAVGCAGTPSNPVAAKRADPEVIDLMTAAGTSSVGGGWTFAIAEIKEVPSKLPSGDDALGHAITPVPGAPGWTEAKWQAIGAESLSRPRGPAKVSFAWYRITIHLPSAATDKRVEFECTVDDYAEVWVNEKLDRAVGQVGGSVVAGFNVPNRVVLTEQGKQGEKFEVAVFGINGPISASPDNYIFFRSARLLISDKP